MWDLTVCFSSFQLKEFANFDFDVWRKKYMRWMNHKKSRVMDFFRRIDKDQDGKITRQEFIDGILASSKLSTIFFLVLLSAASEGHRGSALKKIKKRFLY